MRWTSAFVRRLSHPALWYCRSVSHRAGYSAQGMPVASGVSGSFSPRVRFRIRRSILYGVVTSILSMSCAFAITNLKRFALVSQPPEDTGVSMPSRGSLLVSPCKREKEWREVDPFRICCDSTCIFAVQVHQRRGKEQPRTQS